jgi:hypothetical protein
MGRSEISVWRPLAILGLPEYEVPRFITHARSILLATSQSSWFPAPVPSLATLEAAIDALEQAEVATHTMVGVVPARDRKRLVAKQLFEQLRTYVQTIADANPEHAVAIIESAGMTVKGKGGRKASVASARPGEVSGEVIATAPRLRDRDSYEWQMSTDGMKTWGNLPSTKTAKTTVSGLTPGTTVYFRYRIVTNDGPTDWSEPFSVVVP